jgi:hypothetical protein
MLRRAFYLGICLGVPLCALFAPATAPAEVAPRADRPWMNIAATAEERTRILLEAMTQDEKLALVLGYFSSDAPWKNFKRPEGGLEQRTSMIVPPACPICSPSSWPSNSRAPAR